MTIFETIQKRTSKSSSGQSIIELIIAMAIMAIVLPALFAAFMTARSGKAQENQQLQAVALLKETEEVVRDVRNTSWTTFAGFSGQGVVSPYIPAGITNWALQLGADTPYGFTRKIVISDVYRDVNGAIASSGTNDPSTKKATITISWGSPIASTLSSVIYLTRHDNQAMVQDTDVDFNQTGKVFTNTVVNGTGLPAVVQLAAGGGGGDWCNPSFAITNVNLSRQGIPTSISAYSVLNADSSITNHVVTGTGGNASGPTFVKTTVTGDSNPQATFVGQFNNAKANQVFTETKYGYIATTNHSSEIQILDLSTASGNPPTYSQIGYFDAPGNGNGLSIFASGSTGYMANDVAKFYTFNISSHSGSRGQLGTAALTANGQKIIVVGGYAFIAENSTSRQLEIVNVSDPANPTVVAYANLGNNQAGVDVAVNATGTRAYVVTNYIAGTNDFFIINTQNKSGSLPIISSYSTSGMSPKGVAVVTGNKAIVVGQNGSKQYQVIDLRTETALQACGNGLAINGGAYAIAPILQTDGWAFAYVVTGDTNAELKIILGGGGGTFSYNGTYISPPFDVSSLGFTQPAHFNRFDINGTQPFNTTMKFQLAAATPTGIQTCQTATYSSFYGPTSTTDSYTTSSAIPLTNPAANGTCLKYKVDFLTTDYTQTPVLNTFMLNLSP